MLKLQPFRSEHKLEPFKPAVAGVGLEDEWAVMMAALNLDY